MHFIEEINTLTADLPRHLAATIRDVCMKAAHEASAAESAYQTAVELDEMVESTSASIRLLSGIEREARVKAERFNELLHATIRVATAGAAAVPEKVDHEAIYMTVESVPPHSFALRDLVNVSLEVPVLGKISARGPILAVCELTEGCWISSQASNLKILTRGTRFLAMVQDDGSFEKICPFSIKSNEMSGSQLRNKLFPKIGYNVTQRIDHLVGKPKESKEITHNVHTHPSGERTNFTPGLLSYLELNAWYCGDERSDREQFKFGPPSHINGIIKNSINPIVHAGGRTDLKEYNMIGASGEPKFKVLRYERSYRVLVAAPWDFELDSLRARIAGGEQLNLRDEFERVLIGTEAPKLIYGRGIEFEHVLESQLSAFTL